MEWSIRMSPIGQAGAPGVGVVPPLEKLPAKSNKTAALVCFKRVGGSRQTDENEILKKQAVGVKHEGAQLTGKVMMRRGVSG